MLCAEPVRGGAEAVWAVVGKLTEQGCWQWQCHGCAAMHGRCGSGLATHAHFLGGGPAAHEL